MAGIPPLGALNQAQSAQQIFLQRQSSGLRINSAKDDAAGLAIVTRLAGQLTGTAQASRNASDALSVADTASSALSTVSDSLQQIRDLTIQAANGTNSPSDLQSIQAQINQLTQGINDVTNNTDFNGQQLFSGTFSATLQVGPNAGQTSTLTIGGTSPTALGISTIDVTQTVGGVNLGAAAATTAIDTAIDTVNSQQANIGAISAGLSSTIANLNNSYENIAATSSRIASNDYASSSSGLASANVKVQAGIHALVAYNSQQKAPLRLLGIA